jgi:serine/threonine protein kinase
MSSRNFGRYKIIRELGHGGMSVVYLAHDPVFDRDVALKVLPNALLHDPTFRARFDSEARLIAQLEHPAIIPVYDYGENQGQPFITMRLMRGGSLADRLKSGPLALVEINQITQHICDALDKAHSHQIIHRDIKPQNILFDEDGRAYLGDFGIARLAESTQTMTIVGTPQYMAPEQAHGHNLDARTDVYQMGVVLFEMLVGEPPFEADTPVALLHKHAYAQIPSVRKINAQIPRQCEIVVKQALEKEQNQRFATAGDLATNFNAAAIGKLSSKRPLLKTTVLEADVWNQPDNIRTAPTQRRLMWGVGAMAIIILLMSGLYWELNGQNHEQHAFNQPAPSRIAPTATTSQPLRQQSLSITEENAINSIALETTSNSVSQIDTTATKLATATSTATAQPTRTPRPTNTPRLTPTPEKLSADDFPFGRGIIVVGGGYSSLDDARRDLEKFVEAGYETAVFVRNDDIRTVLTGYTTESRAEANLGRVQAIRETAYTRDLVLWCPLYLAHADHYECQ